ncbi:uncharacterized protein LOC113345413 isoform X2 [Papaver somniferum]|uniref:uncharacterized protein LOC113345413 isoform X2 n=1 Tax=Papaver somniferum TaxID=3469 RepID=UPI000E6FF322|nr:uncharacterized protein LOC113345413 isoform X2 [Papaver somniferum]
MVLAVLLIEMTVLIRIQLKYSTKWLQLMNCVCRKSMDWYGNGRMNQWIVDLEVGVACHQKRTRATEANKGKTKDAGINKRKKDGLGTPHSLPPRGREQGRNKRLGANTRGEVWESGRDRSRLVIREPTGTVEHDEKDEEEREEDEDNEVDPSQLATQTEVVKEVVGSSQQPTQGKGKGKGKGKVKVKGSHLPHTDDMIPVLARGRIWGEAPQPKLLFGS